MYRIPALFLLICTFISCSKMEQGPPTPDVIPTVIRGTVTEFTVTPIDINTPDKGTFYIFTNNTSYKVEFNVTTGAQSNAELILASDTILTDQSREFADLGKDAIAYYPVADNQIEIFFSDGRKINGTFDFNTSFGGVFGEQLIRQWRNPNDPSKPTQKAKDDIINLVHRYKDKDGPGPGTAPEDLFVTVTKR